MAPFGREDGEPGDHPHLEGEEANKLGQGDDAVGGPAGVDERLLTLARRVPRVEREKVRVLEGRSQPDPQRIGERRGQDQFGSCLLLRGKLAPE